MSKKLKISIISTLSIILIVGIAFALPEIVEAAGIGNNDIHYYHEAGTETYKSMNLNELVGKEVNISGIIFKNKGVFCAEPGQEIFTSGYRDDEGKWVEGKYVRTYKLESPMTTTDYSVDQGLAYILSHERTNGLGGYNGEDLSESNKWDNSWGEYNKDPVQIALWCYLRKAVDEKANLPRESVTYKIIKDHGEFGEIIGESSGNWIGLKGEKNTYGGNTPEGRTAYKYYKEALNIKKGISSSKKYYATIYRFVHFNNEAQDLIIVKNTSEQNAIPTINLKFKKVQPNNQGLSGAQFTIATVSGGNVSSVSPTKLTASSGGLFSQTVTVKPQTNSGTFKLKITETAPTNYTGIGAVTVTVTYDKSSGKVTGISGSEFVTATGSSSGGTISIKNYPKVKIDFSKIDQTGKVNVPGAKLKVSAVSNVKTLSKTELTSNSGGSFGQVLVTPTTNNGIFKIKIEETSAPTGYMKFSGEIELEVRYNVNTGEVSSITRTNGEDSVITSGGSTGIVKVENRRLPKIDLRLRKKDDNGQLIEGAKFQIEYKQGEDVLSTLVATSNENGLIDFNPDVQPKTNSDVIAKITELEAPTGYKLFKDSIALRFKYTIMEDGNATWVASVDKDVEDRVEIVQQTQYEDNSDVLIVANVVNKSMIEKLTLLKADSQNIDTKVQGAKFKVTLHNVESISGYPNFKDGNSIIETTDANGQIVLEDIVITDATKDVTITMEETYAPVGYKKLIGTITLTLHRNGDDFTLVNVKKDDSINDIEFKAEDVKFDKAKYEISLNIKDVPIMNLGGIAWLDEQQGEKDVQGQNGKIDSNEERFAGMKVELYKGNEKITKDEYGRDLTLKTAEDGASIKYDLNNGNVGTLALEKGEYVFPNLERGTDYYVVFTFDGINYQTVPVSDELYVDNNKSKVTEVDRQGFNDRFKTITDDPENEDTEKISFIKAYSYEDEVDEANLGYAHTTNDQEINTSKLLTTTSNNPNENILDPYVMKAKSSTCYLQNNADWLGTWNKDGTINRNHYALDVNCGLLDKFFDLALGTDVYSAELTINGKSTTYEYNQIINGASLDAFLNNDVTTNSNIIYNLYLYSSDYNFRIEDYVTDDAGSNPMNKDDAKSISENRPSDLDELRAFVTYKVVLYNQSTYAATVDEIAYYYDEHYKFDHASNANGDRIDIEFNDSEDNGVTPLPGKNVARISGFGESLEEGTDYRQEIYLTFEVIKSGENGGLPDEIEDGGLECANLAEILTYTTDKGGLMDEDSAPGNMVINGNVRHEDDSDEAQGINITIRDSERHITGTVFDDSNKDGIADSETPVNDVIVQLIEIKTVKGQNFEYIWQETRSGSNTVKATAINGYRGPDYTTDVSGDGNFKFEGYIPGNYIIRYVYGDGRTYEVTDSVKQYNGQDYKSTIDKNYKAEWYNDSAYDKGNISVARDNEARRLEVMAYSTRINKDIGQKLEDKTALNETWMAAETSRINIPVDTDNKSTISSSTTVSFDTITNTLFFDNMNFGLALRPQTKLVLEKHITALKITPNGTGVQPIVEANANIEQIINDTDVETAGNVTGLATIKSTRGERGFWKVETDVEELAQGAQLEVEYTYVIRNDSDEDYLSNTLVNKYKEDVDGYSGYLTTEAGTLKLDTKGNTHLYGSFLGQYYYTGVKADTDAAVLSRVEELEEALNNDLKYDEEIKGDDFAKTNTDKVTKPYYGKDGNSTTKDIDTVIRATNPSNFLTRKVGDSYDSTNADFTKTIKLITALASSSNGEVGGDYPSYIAEVIEYSNVAGRRNMEAEPENLSYVHSEDTTMTMENSNEVDEFWGESINISKPTGEDRLTPVQITIITISSIAVIGVAIILIKKFVLKK